MPHYAPFHPSFRAFAALWAFGVLSFIATDAAEAQLARRGGEFIINSFTEGNQREPHVAALPDGGFVVVWEDEGQVVLRRFDRESEAMGPEIPVNSGGACYPPEPSFAAASDGSMLVAWCVTDDQGTHSINGRRLSPDGRAEERQFRIATGVYRGPYVAAIDTSEFVVTWTGYYSGYGRLVGASEEGPIFSILSSGNQYDVAAAGTDGSFRVVWYDGGGLMIGRSFQGMAPIGEPFEITRVSSGLHQGPAICQDDNGAFVVAWSTYAPDDDIPITYRLYDADGAPHGTPIEAIPSENLRIQAGPGLACGTADAFAILWTDISTDPAQTTLRGRAFTRQGPVESSAFRIGGRDFGGRGTPGSIAVLADEDLLVTFHDLNPSGGYDVFGQRFTFRGSSDCRGDCNRDGNVTIDELIAGVTIALQSSNSSMKSCLPMDSNLDYRVGIDELIRATKHALGECPSSCLSHLTPRTSRLSDASRR